MSPLEAWYAHIGVEEFMGLIDDPAVQKRVRRRIEKAKDERTSELDYPKLAEMVGGQMQIKDQPPLIFHHEMARAPGAKALLDAHQHGRTVHFQLGRLHLRLPSTAETRWRRSALRQRW